MGEQKRREEELLNSTPEARQAEKLRLQRLEEERERELAREMIGLSTEEMSSGLNFKATTQEEFDSLRTGLLEKLRDLESSDLYAEFAFSLLSGMCTNLNIPTLKKVKSEAEAFISAKLKEEKANKGKKGKPAKATIRMETDRSMFGRGLDDGYNDMDDFMWEEEKQHTRKADFQLELGTADAVAYKGSTFWKNIGRFFDPVCSFFSLFREVKMRDG